MIRFLGILSFLIIAHTLTAQKIYTAKKSVKLMGCRFEISAVATTDSIAWNAVETGITEISRIEKIISSWMPYSQTSKINKTGGKHAVKVNKELFDLIYRSKKIADLTNGAFDISFASMKDIWKFDKQEHTLADSAIVKAASSYINWQNIVLSTQDTSVFLKIEGMKIGFGGIGKGYAANSAKKMMSSIEGVKGGVVNASGDLIAWGVNEVSNHWTIQIANPKNKEQAIGWLSLENMSIVTSGDYEKYFMSKGVRYSHIINPQTGYPVTGIKSVSVLCPDAELADALATSVFVLGKIKGLYLINNLSHIECIIITDDGKMHISNNLKINYH